MLISRLLRGGRDDHLLFRVQSEERPVFEAASLSAVKLPFAPSSRTFKDFTALLSGPTSEPETAWGWPGCFRLQTAQNRLGLTSLAPLPAFPPPLSFISHILLDSLMEEFQRAESTALKWVDEISKDISTAEGESVNPDRVATIEYMKDGIKREWRGMEDHEQSQVNVDLRKLSYHIRRHPRYAELIHVLKINRDASSPEQVSVRREPLEVYRNVDEHCLILKFRSFFDRSTYDCPQSVAFSRGKEEGIIW